jgi:SAM-dependent methyltransferase
MIKNSLSIDKLLSLVEGDSPDYSNQASGGQLKALYEDRFAGTESNRISVWYQLSRHFFQQWVEPTATVLDIGAGYCEFINTISAGRKYAIDLNPETVAKAGRDVTVIQQDVRERWPLESESVDVAFSSNFFEHLTEKQAIWWCLNEAYRVLKPGGRMIAIGPNIRFCAGLYWDFFDHHLPLSDRTMEEVFMLNGFKIERLVPRFLPYSMRGHNLRRTALLVRLYLMMPFVWNIFGKQFLVVARKPSLER